MAVPTINNPPDDRVLDERVRGNIRMLKAYRKISDATIAERAAYTSRQQVADRIGGRTGLSLSDVVRISYALEIDFDALLAPPTEMMRYVSDQEALSQREGSVVVVETKSTSAPRKRPAKRTASK